MAFIAGVVANSIGTPSCEVTWRMFAFALSEMKPLSSVKA